jgi:hypothetical protein
MTKNTLAEDMPTDVAPIETHLQRDTEGDAINGNIFNNMNGLRPRPAALDASSEDTGRGPKCA